MRKGASPGGGRAETSIYATGADGGQRPRLSLTDGGTYFFNFSYSNDPAAEAAGSFSVRRQCEIDVVLFLDSHANYFWKQKKNSHIFGNK